MKMWGNFVANLVPHPLRQTKRWYVQDDPVGYVRDYVFLFYQTNALFVTGSVMGAVAAWLVYRRGKRAPAWERWFWWGLIGWLPVAAAVVLDVPSEEGAAHLFFHAWAMMAGALVAACAGGLRPWVRIALGAGLAVDFVLGVFLHFYAENRVFALLPGGVLETYGRAPHGAVNWLGKHEMGWVFFGDLCAPVAGLLMGVQLVAGLVAATGVAIGWWFQPRRTRMVDRREQGTEARVGKTGKKGAGRSWRRGVR